MMMGAFWSGGWGWGCGWGENNLYVNHYNNSPKLEHPGILTTFPEEIDLRSCQPAV